MNYIQCWQCFVLSRRTTVKRPKAFFWVTAHWSVMELSTPSWDDLKEKRKKKIKKDVPLVLSLVGVRARPGCSVCCRRQGDALLVHSFGLRAHDEAEEVLVWYSWPSDRGRGRSTALVIQTGSLVGTKGRRSASVWDLVMDSKTIFNVLHACCAGNVFFFKHCVSLSSIKHLTLDEHIEEVVVRLGTVSVGHQVAEHGLVAVLIEPEAGQASSSCCWQLL